MALKSLKEKMGSAPRRPNPIMNIGANGTRKFIPTFDIDGQMNSQNYPTKPVNYNMNNNTPMMASRSLCLIINQVLIIPQAPVRIIKDLLYWEL